MTPAQISKLLKTDDIRLIHKLKYNEVFAIPDEGEKVFSAVILDTETTGLDSSEDKIIELGMIKFTFTSSGKIIEVIDTLSSFEDPGMPLPDVIKEITGITDDDVKGCKIDDEEVLTFLKDVKLIIAHNAQFDRAFFEKRFGGLDGIKMMRWACSISQIPWSENLMTSSKLEWIAFKYGYFYDAHRALEDSRVVLEILNMILPNTGTTAFAHLLEESRQIVYNVNAVKSPFSAKDKLKARGYKWNPDDKFWFFQTKEEGIQEEVDWLNKEVYTKPIKVQVHPINRNRRHVH